MTHDELIRQLHVADMKADVDRVSKENERLRQDLAAARALLKEAQYFVPSGLLRDRIDATLEGKK